jgi:uncharacterized membrane protein YeaQ/YmgE (transglycosylase-associated protein family)
MEITGVLSALFIGVVVGALGRLALPGRQKIGFLLTVLIGIVAALFGTFLAEMLGVADTRGVDWIELALQVAAAALAIAAFTGLRHANRRGRRPDSHRPTR